jgi:hypothetical protein
MSGGGVPADRGGLLLRIATPSHEEEKDGV